MVLVRLPRSFHDFDAAAAAQAGRNQLGGALATADSVSLSDRFVRAAFAVIPRDGRFVVALPSNPARAEAQHSISPITFDAIPALFEDFLLPRREVTAAAPRTYVICYFCDSTWSRRTRWLWSNGSGGARIGYLQSR
jgi:hypothetical protein